MKKEKKMKKEKINKMIKYNTDSIDITREYVYINFNRLESNW